METEKYAPQDINPAPERDQNSSQNYTYADKLRVWAILEDPKSQELLADIFSKQFSAEDLANLRSYLSGTEVSPERETLFLNFMEAARKRLRVLEGIIARVENYRTVGESSKLPSLDYYDNRRATGSGAGVEGKKAQDKGIPYQGRYGRYENDDRDY